MPSNACPVSATARREARHALWASAGVLLAYAACARLPLGATAAACLREALGLVLVGLPLARGNVTFGGRAGRRSVRCALWLAAVVLPAWLLLRACATGAWTLAPPWRARGGDAASLLGSALRAAWVHVVAVALPEELFWRGYVQPALQARFVPRRRLAGAPMGLAAACSCALFAVSHVAGGGALATLGTFVPGLLFAWLQARHGAVSGPWLLHACCNLFALAAEAYLPAGR